MDGGAWEGERWEEGRLIVLDDACAETKYLIGLRALPLPAGRNKGGHYVR